MAVAQVPVLCVTAAVASTLVVAVRKIIEFRTKMGSTRCIAVVQPEGKTHFKAVLLPLSGVIAQQCLAKSSSLQYTSVLGIDCEWQPEKGRSHSPVSLLQFAPSEDTCFLAQLLYMDSMPEQIRSVLQDPLVIKVGIGVREDVRRLTTDYSLTIRSVVDLVDVIKATQPSLLLEGCSLAAISKTLLQLDVDKSCQCSDWGNRQLSKQQLRYAALDAWLALRVAGQLHQLLLAQQQSDTSSSPSVAVGGAIEAAGKWDKQQAAQSSVPEDLAVFLSQYIIHRPSDKISAATKQQQALTIDSSPDSAQQYMPTGPVLPPRKQQQQAQQLRIVGAAVAQQQWQCLQQQQQQWQQLDDQQQIQLLHQSYQYMQGLNVLGANSMQEQRQQQVRTRQGAGLRRSSCRQQQDFQQQQERRQRQLEQLERLGQQAAAPTRSIFDRMQNLKPARLPTRKSLQYENCRIVGPDGKALATCGAKKVKWYLDRGLAEVVEDEPTVAIRLKFKPRGSGHADDQYYLSDKDNKCVVCGHEGEYLRHSIVPHCYRQHFPQNMKSHLSHDIVLMCVGCHQICNILDQKKMQEIGVRYGAPLEDESRRFRTDRHLAQVRSAGRALSNSKAAGKIPPARVKHLRSIIMQHFSATEWQDSLATAANEVEPSSQEEGWASHGSVVVAALMAAGQQQQQQQQQPGHVTVSGAAEGATVAKVMQMQQQQSAATSQQVQQQIQQQQRPDDRTGTTRMFHSCGVHETAPVGLLDEKVTAGVTSESAFSSCTDTASAVRQPCSDPNAASSSSYPGAAGSHSDESSKAQPAESAHDKGGPAAGKAEASVGESSCYATQHKHAANAYHWAGNGGLLALSAASTAGYSRNALQLAVTAVVSAAQEDCWNVETTTSSSKAVQYGFHSVLSAASAAAVAIGPVAGIHHMAGEDGSSSTPPDSSQHKSREVLMSVKSSTTRIKRSSNSRDVASSRGAGTPAAAADPAAEAALGEFIRDWRRHFLAVMQPKHLPPFWSIDARVKNSSGADMPGAGEQPEVIVMDGTDQQQQVVVTNSITPKR